MRSPSARADRRLIGLFLLVALIVFAVDQLTKIWAVATLTEQPPRAVLGDFLRLTIVRNPGAAFSIGTGNTVLLSLIAVLVLAFVVHSSRRLGSRAWAVALGLILGGALGNLTDRLARAPGVGAGHVVDFLDYNGWFVGNVADIAIVAAACLIALLAFRGIGIDGSREGRAGPPPASETAGGAASAVESGIPGGGDDDARGQRRG